MGEFPQTFHDINRAKLLNFLANNVSEIPTSNKVTFGENVLNNTIVDLKGIAPCKHEEAVTRMFVHA